MKLTLTFLALSTMMSTAFIASAARRSSGVAFGLAARGGAVTPSSSTVLRMSSTTSPEELIKTSIAENKVVVFSKSYCPFCAKTKSLLEQLGVEAAIYELDQRGDGRDIQLALEDMTGQRTVPSTFINGEHIGGNDALQAANKSGELAKKLGL